MRLALIQAIPTDKEGIPVADLPDRVIEYLAPDDLVRLGAWRWYVHVVRLDMQASGKVIVVPDSAPERVRRPTQSPGD